VESKPFYAQIVKFLQRLGYPNYAPSKIEIAEWLAVSCENIPKTYTILAELIKKIRSAQPVQVKV
jgi:DNA-binding MurR/RpiR family transcriptional regulator